MADTVERLVDILRKFADDTKLGQTVENDEDTARLKEALDKLCSWASKWGMVFNVAKCKVMHMGSRNPGYSYSTNNQILESTAEERDIGVVISENIKACSPVCKGCQDGPGSVGPTHTSLPL
jgi:hypothetical protein